MSDETKKPFACTTQGCEMAFTNEDHLNWHQKKHDMVLNLGLANKNSDVSDQTPTPTRFIRNCEEVGLFQDLQHVNPFDETFKKAIESKSDTGLQTLHIPDASTDDTLHTPHIFPPVEETTKYAPSNNIRISSENIETINLDEEDVMDCLYMADDVITEKEKVLPVTTADDKKDNQETYVIKDDIKTEKSETRKRQLNLKMPAIESKITNDHFIGGVKNESFVTFLTDVEDKKDMTDNVANCQNTASSKIKEITKNEIRKKLLPKFKITPIKDGVTNSETNSKENSIQISTSSQVKKDTASEAEKKHLRVVPTLKVNDVEVHLQDIITNIDNHTSMMLGTSQNGTGTSIQSKTSKDVNMRERIRECNRAAQKRCRKKKVMEQRKIEVEIRNLRIENVKLRIENKYLKEQLAQLKSSIIAQNKGGDDATKSQETTLNTDTIEKISKELSPAKNTKLKEEISKAIVGPIKPKPTQISSLPPLLPNTSANTIILQVPPVVPGSTSIIVAPTGGLLTSVPLLTTVPVTSHNIVQQIGSKNAAILPNKKPVVKRQLLPKVTEIVTKEKRPVKRKRGNEPKGD